MSTTRPALAHAAPPPVAPPAYAACHRAEALAIVTDLTAGPHLRTLAWCWLLQSRGRRVSHLGLHLTRLRLARQAARP